MKSHLELSDQEFEIQFADCSLDPSLFSHEAYLRRGWIHVNKYGEACENVCQQIQNFDATHDKGEKPHKTLTMACIKTIDHFKRKTKANSFLEFMAEFPRLKNNFKQLIS
jgi:hypothetical protein